MPVCGGIFDERKLEAPFWYAISHRRLRPSLDPERYLRLLVDSSAQVIQLREKDVNRELLLAWIRFGVRCAREAGKLFLVNGEPEVALLGGADGVHLPGGSDPGSARRAAAGGPPGFLIGLSVHSVDEAAEAGRRGADYVLLAPVFHPISKRGRPPLGLDSLREACERAEIPVIALGGITRETAPLAFAAGAAGVAGISWVNDEIGGRLAVSPQE